MRKNTLFLLICLLSFPWKGVQGAGVTLEWDANSPEEPDLSGYRLFQSTVSFLPPGLSALTTAQALTLPDPPMKVADNGKTVTRVRVTGLNLPATYYFRLTAFDLTNNHSGFNVNTPGNVAFQVSVDATRTPAMPTGLQAVAASSTSVVFSWDDTAANETGFIIERRQGSSGAFVEIARTAANTESHMDTGLSPSTSYSYRAIAFNSEGESNIPTAVGGTTLAPPPDNMAPTSPGTPVISNLGSTSFTATWAAATDNVAVTGYNVDVAMNTSFSGMLAGYNNRDVGTSLSAVISGLSPGTTYYIRARARDAQNNISAHSGWAQVDTLTLAPPTLQYIVLPDPGVTYFRGTMPLIQAALVPAGGVADPALLKGYTFTFHASDDQGNTYPVETMRTTVLGSAANHLVNTAKLAARNGTLTFHCEARNGTDVIVGAGRTLKFDSTVPMQRVAARVFEAGDNNPQSGDFRVELPLRSVDVAGVNLTRLSESGLPPLAGMSGQDPFLLSAFDFSVSGKSTMLFNRPVAITLSYPDNEDADGDGVSEGDGQVDDIGVEEDSLKIIWLDGQNWRMIGGRVDKTNNTVTAMTYHFSTYALVSVSGLAPGAKAQERFLSPALADNINDVATFGMEAQEVMIVDVNGKQVFHATQDDMRNSAITWTCRDESGRLLPSGTYIARIRQTNGGLVYQTLALVK